MLLSSHSIPLTSSYLTIIMTSAIPKKTHVPPGLYKAVFFDIGGVVVGSPFQGIADFEREHNLPPNYLNVAMYVFSRSILSSPYNLTVIQYRKDNSLSEIY
jgi:hypothetical protein